MCQGGYPPFFVSAVDARLLLRGLPKVSHACAPIFLCPVSVSFRYTLLLTELSCGGVISPTIGRCKCRPVVLEDLSGEVLGVASLPPCLDGGVAAVRGPRAA